MEIQLLVSTCSLSLFLNIMGMLQTLVHRKTRRLIAESLELLEAQVQRCAYLDAKSFQDLQHLIRKIVNVVQQHYRSGNDSLVFFDRLQRFQQAQLHLQVFTSITLDTGNGEHYKRAFENAKADTLYLVTLLRSAIRFGHLLPVTPEQEARPDVSVVLLNFLHSGYMRF